MTRTVDSDDPVDAHDVADHWGVGERNNVVTYVIRYLDVHCPVVDTAAGRWHLPSPTVADRWKAQQLDGSEETRR